MSAKDPSHAAGTEFGIFNDEGCLERQFYSSAEANIALAARYTREDAAWTAPLCHDHADTEQAANNCEACQADEEDDDAGNAGDPSTRRRERQAISRSLAALSCMRRSGETPATLRRRDADIAALEARFAALEEGEC